MSDKPGSEWKDWEDLPPEMEDEMVERIARFVVRKNLGLMAQMALESGGSLTTMFATLGMATLGPFLEFFGADTYTALLRRRENVDRLMRRIDELEEDKRKKEKERKDALRKPDKPRAQQ